MSVIFSESMRPVFVLYITEVCHLFHLKPATQTGAKLPLNGA